MASYCVSNPNLKPELGWAVREEEGEDEEEKEEEKEEKKKRKILEWLSSSMRLWIAATAVGQASQRIVPMTRTVESFSLPYLTKCTISSHLISVEIWCVMRYWSGDGYGVMRDSLLLALVCFNRIGSYEHLVCFGWIEDVTLSIVKMLDGSDHADNDEVNSNISTSNHGMSSNVPIPLVQEHELKNMFLGFMNQWFNEFMQMNTPAQRPPPPFIPPVIPSVAPPPHLIEFKKKYVGKRYLDMKKREFLELRQGNKSMVEYEREFVYLSKYAREIVPTEEEMCIRFEDGLNDEIQMIIGVPPVKKTREDFSQTTSVSEHPNKNKSVQHDFKVPTKPVDSVGSVRNTPNLSCKHCGKHHPGECRAKSGAYYRCGSTGYSLRNCPK
ncbi:hypothetical protein Gotur_013307 [Gossypium turneri]